MREENARLTGIVRAIEPYADDVRRIVTDEGYRDYVRESTRYYDELAQRKPTDLDPGLAAVRDELREEIRPMRELADKYTTQQRAEREARINRTFQEGKAIVEPFLQQHPELRTNRGFGATLDALQNEAVERDVPFKEVWDNYTSGFAPQPRERKTPPPSLRANDGDQGIPAAARPAPKPAEGQPQSVREAFMDAWRRNGKAS